MRVCVSNLYPEDIVLGCSRHRLLQAFVQLLLHGQVSGDGPPNLGTNVMQCPQARLHTDKTNCSAALWNNTVINMFILVKDGSVPTHSIHFIPPHISVIGTPKSHNLKNLPLLSERPDNITNMHRFMIKINKTCLCTCRERAVLGGTLATSPCSFLFLNLRKYSWMRKVA